MSVVLSEHLPLLATAPDGIQKLRGLILELAVRGKLVSQDPKDEPASELLKLIAKERARLEAEGTCKKSKATPLLGEDEQPFALPVGWEWTRLGEVSRNVQYGYTASADHASKDVLFLRITDIQDDRVGWDSVPGCKIPEADVSAYQLLRGDIVIARTGGTIGKSYLVEGLDRRAIFASYLIRVGYLDGTDARYKKVFLGSECYWSQLYANSMGTGQPNVNGTALSGLTFPLPPLAEQHRIVAKVDELMALCDRLEAEQTDAEAAHAKLVETLLGTLTRSTDAADLAANWQRLSEHFDTLFTTESSLDALKQAILQLAVMGKLMPQDPNDEPASKLLKRIARERAQLEAEGICKKSKAMPLLDLNQRPFEVPDGWEWTTLADLLAVVTDGDHLPPPKASDGVPFLVIGNLNAGIVTFDGCRYVPDSYFNELDWSRRPTAGDLLYTVTGSYGIAIPVTTTAPFCVQRHVAILKSVASSPISYLWRYLQSRPAKLFADSSATGIAQKTVTLGALRVMPVAVPPLAEQHRIVAKVDELMALCDRLKTDLAESRTRQARLSATLIESALQAA